MADNYGRVAGEIDIDTARGILFPPEATTEPVETQDDAQPARSSAESQVLDRDDPKVGHADRDEDESESEKASAESDDDEEQAEPPESLDELAERSGLSKSALYKLPAFRSAIDGKPVSLGELKDKWQELQTVEQLRVEAEDARSADIRQRVEFNRQMQVAVQALQNGGLTADNIATVQRAIDQANARERAMIEQAIPQFNEVRPALRKLAETHGIPGDVFDTIHSSGFMSIVHRLHVLENRLERAKAAENKARPKPPSRTVKLSKAEAAANLRRDVATGKISQREAARKLIFGG